MITLNRSSTILKWWIIVTIASSSKLRVVWFRNSWWFNLKVLLMNVWHIRWECIKTIKMVWWLIRKFTSTESQSWITFWDPVINHLRSKILSMSIYKITHVRLTVVYTSLILIWIIRNSMINHLRGLIFAMTCHKIAHIRIINIYVSSILVLT